jgi:hypothetical protein
MLECLYNRCTQDSGLAESLEIADAKGAIYTHQVKFVFRRLNKPPPSKEAIGLLIYFGRLENNMSQYTITRFDYMEASTSLFNKIYTLAKNWAGSVLNVLDAQRLVTNQLSVIKLELLRKVPLFV